MGLLIFFFFNRECYYSDSTLPVKNVLDFPTFSLHYSIDSKDCLVCSLGLEIEEGGIGNGMTNFDFYLV